MSEQIKLAFKEMPELSEEIVEAINFDETLTVACVCLDCQPFFGQFL